MNINLLNKILQSFLPVLFISGSMTFQPLIAKNSPLSGSNDHTEELMESTGEYYFHQEDSVDGLIIFLRKDNEQAIGQIFSIEPDGIILCQLTSYHAGVNSFIASPDGFRLLIYSGDNKIYLFDVFTASSFELRSQDLQRWSAAWSPDNNKIAFLTSNFMDPYNPPEGIVIYDVDIDEYLFMDKDFQDWGYNFGWSTGDYLVWEQFTFDPPAADVGPEYWPNNVIFTMPIEGNDVFVRSAKNVSEECSHPKIIPSKNTYSCTSMYGENDIDVFLFDYLGNQIAIYSDVIPHNWLEPRVANSWYLKWSNDGTKLVFETKSGFSVFDIANEKSRELNTDGGRKPHWNLGGNQLVYEIKGGDSQALQVINFNSQESRQLTSGDYFDTNPIWVPNNISKRTNSNQDEQNWIAYVGEDNNVWFIHPDGTGEKQITFDGSINEIVYGDLNWSPDGRKLGFTRTNRETSLKDIYIYELDTDQQMMILSSRETDGSFDWFKNSDQIIFSAPTIPIFEENRNGVSCFVDYEEHAGLFILTISSGDIDEFASFQNEFPIMNPVLSPNGKHVLFEFKRPGSYPNINQNIVNVSNPNNIININGVQSDCSWKPDSTHLACGQWDGYDTGVSGDNPLGIYDIQGRMVSVTPAGAGNYDNFPIWSPNGKSILFNSSTYPVDYMDGPCGGGATPTGGEFVEILHIDNNKRKYIADGRANDWSPNSQYILLSNQVFEETNRDDSGRFTVRSGVFRNYLYLVDVTNSSLEPMFLTMGKNAKWQPVSGFLSQIDVENSGAIDFSTKDVDALILEKETIIKDLVP